MPAKPTSSPDIYKTKKQYSSNFYCNSKNLWLNFCSTGAGIRWIKMLSGDSMFQNIALSFLGENLWKQNQLYAGATLAPAAGRIKDGILPIGEQSFILSRNENGVTHLHGGFHNLSFQKWTVTGFLPGKCITFSSLLPEGMDGYPGNRSFHVTYHYSDSTLTIQQKAFTDHPTYINMSNHTYYNLNGFTCSGLDQYLYIRSHRVILNDCLQLPAGETDIKDTEFDFSEYRIIQKQIEAFPGSGQLALSQGYNHCFLLTEPGDMSSPAYSLMSADRKRSIDFYTDAPALIFYSGGYIRNNLRILSDNDTAVQSFPGCAVALEPTYPPLGYNQEYYITNHTFIRSIILDFKTPPEI